MKLREHLPEADVGVGATEAEIAAAQAALQVRLPRSFRLFLRQMGWLDDALCTVYGLGADVPAHMELVRNVEGERHHFQPYVPIHLVPFSPDGAGNHWCLDTSRFDGDECPVVFWDHERGPGQVSTPQAASFGAWLAQQVADEAAAAAA